jgi:hypothetical protein
MAHPFHDHGEHRHGRERVKHILKSGGAAHPDAAADKKLFSEMIAKHDRGETKVEGGKGRSRFARGGRTKHKGNQTNIAIVVPQKGGSPSEPQGGPPISPLAGPPPPMMPPGGPPPGGPPMRASGGRVGGDSTKANLDKWSARAKENSYARGGRLPTAGAESGVGRLQKAR